MKFHELLKVFVFKLRFRAINMQVYFKEFTLSTRKCLELVDITKKVTAFVSKCNIESGISLVNSRHSTTTIIVNEHEGGLMRDILRKVQEAFPKGAGWWHVQILAALLFCGFRLGYLHVAWTFLFQQ